MLSLKECCAEGFHPPVAESFALASRSPMHVQKNQEENQDCFSPWKNISVSLYILTLKMLLGNFISHHEPFVKKRSYYSFRYGERVLIMTSPSSFLHPVLMLTKNVLAPVEIVLLVTDPINFINVIFIVLFQSWASFVQSVRNIHYNEAYISPTLNIHH